MAATTSSQSSTINVLLTSFPGLGLPSTLCIPTSADSTVHDLITSLQDRLSIFNTQRLILTTSSNKQISLASQQPLSSLLNARTSYSTSTPASTATQDAQPQLLTLRLSAPLCGGKGGFGSQLRAAGGRMSSRKKRSANDAAALGSNRNLDGRRLRTVTEAKALAEYLALKPEMEKKEKEERRKKWEAVVEAAERRQEEILSGKAGKLNSRGDAEWLERKEEAETKVREAVERAVRDGLLVGDAAAAAKTSAGLVDAVMAEDEKVEDDESAEDEEDEKVAASSEDNNEAGPSDSSKATTPEEAPQRKIFGWDDEEDDDDDDQE